MIPVARWRNAVKAVDPGMKSPLLWMPLDVARPLVLRLTRRVNSAPTAVQPGVRTERHAVPGTPGVSVVVHHPQVRSQPSGAVLWLFGGGLISGSAEHVGDVASRFAAELGALVIAPDYRVAPENPYPAAIDDCFATLEWMIANAAELGIDPDRVIVGGESAGGGLAAAVAQRAHDAGIRLRLQVLVAPMLDDRTVPRAERDGQISLLWTVGSNRFGWTSYLGHAPGEDEVRPYAVPARRENLDGLAPAWISVGDIDLFHREDVEYARRLREAGIECELHTITGAHHGAELLAPDHPRIREVQQARLDAMRRALGTAAS